MTEFSSNSNGAGPAQLPTSQGLVCFYDDELGKTFLENTIAPVVEVLPRTGPYSANRVRIKARKTSFDPLMADRDGFKTACAPILNYAERLVTIFHKAYAVSDRYRDAGSS